ncbi:MAG: universal stress protein, partial [Deltaproteobacteria bacterium]|nr:universal stress protein [Deltaproteobacteria bacterium]
LNQAKKGSKNLIVMGTHGRTGLQHMLLGSVAERVVRLSPCPVLTVRHTPPRRRKQGRRQ